MATSPGDRHEAGAHTTDLEAMLDAIGDYAIISLDADGREWRVPLASDNGSADVPPA